MNLLYTLPFVAESRQEKKLSRMSSGQAEGGQNKLRCTSFFATRDKNIQLKICAHTQLVRAKWAAI